MGSNCTFNAMVARSNRARPTIISLVKQGVQQIARRVEAM